MRLVSARRARRRGLPFAFVAITALAPTPLAGQADSPCAAAAAGRLDVVRLPAPGTARRGWTRVRVAKWALLGAAAGFGVYALSHSTRADRDYGRLRSFCSEEPDGCALEGGRYVAPRAEALYRGSVREDRRAQMGILGGQVTLLGSVALFVYDLRNARGPENIPYPSGRLGRAPGARRAAVGFSVQF